MDKINIACIQNKTNKHIKILLVFVLVFYSPFLFSQENMNSPEFYKPYMKKLIQLSKINPKYPFAAMIIDNKTGKILCSGVNSSYLNPTYHGEMVAINYCAAKFPKLDWSNTTLITNAEPCSMCASAIVWANIPRLVYGSSIPYFIEHGWNQISLRSETVFVHSPFYKGTIIGGVLHEETDKLFKEAKDVKSV